MHRSANPENVSYVAFPSHSLSVFEDPRVKVTTMCTFANLLFVGTNNGLIVQLMYEERENDETFFDFTKLLSRNIGRRPILHMTASAELNILLFLTGGDLFFYDAEQLEASSYTQRYRGVTAYNCISTSSGYCKLCISFETCLLHILRLDCDGCHFVSELKLEHIPEVISFGRNFLCFAAAGKYLSINLHTKHCAEFFEYDRNSIIPFVKHVGEDEFLVSGPSSLGVIVNPDGISKRPPLQLSTHIVQIFVWEYYVFCVTDEFVTIHNVSNQTQLQTVPLIDASAACFSSEENHLIFIASNTPESGATFLAVGPERWDRFIRKLILADCSQHAMNVLRSEQQRMNNLLQEGTFNYRNEEILFTRRARRVYSLFGFYFFEKGEFSNAKRYFKLGGFDFRELLSRYSYLLPSGYNFAPNQFFSLRDQRTVSGNSSHVDIVGVLELCLLHSGDMSKSNQIDEGLNTVWMIRYDEFLFDMLMTVKQNGVILEYSHLLETSLVKLYIRLSRFGRKPVLPGLTVIRDSYRSSPVSKFDVSNSTSLSDDLTNLVLDMTHLDVDDLTGYLKESGAFHALALVLQWQGNQSDALELWKNLAYGEKSDELFPGVDFYISVLIKLLDSSTTSNVGIMDANAKCIHETEASGSIPSEIVWKHFCYAVDGSKLIILEMLLPSIPFNEDVLTMSCDFSLPEQKDIGLSLAPSQRLSPCNLVKKLLPTFPDLGRKYLRYLIYCYKDVHPAYHNALAELYIQSLINSSVNTEVRTLRREFSHFLRFSNAYSPSAVQDKLACVKSTYPYEFALLLGKNGDHRSALDLLVNQLSDLSAALCYCCSYLIKADGLLHDQSELDAMLPSASVAFTVLVEFCLRRHSDPKYLQLAVQLMNSPNIPLNFSEVLSIMSGAIPLYDLKSFFQRALQSYYTRSDSLLVQYGVNVKQNIQFAATLVNTNRYQLNVGADTKCETCKQAMAGHNQFVWNFEQSKLYHRNCYRGW